MGFDPKVLAHIIIGAIESTAEQIYLFDESPTTQVNHVKENLLQFILNGLGVQNAKKCETVAWT